MAKIAAVVIAAIALAAGVRAGCPPNTFLCGSEITDVLRCATATWLKGLTPPPPGDNIRSDIYPIDSNGVPQIPSASCVLHGCKNSNLTAKPPQNARCFE